ncbi:MAG: DUF2283 domain-containing protein [Armatimonadota bacterium]
MQIRIEAHTLQRAAERGTNAQEIEDVLRTGTDVIAKGGRRAKAKVYPFQQARLGKYYEQKRVEGGRWNHRDRNGVCVLWTLGGTTMQIVYDARNDLLYLRLDDCQQPVVNERVSEDIVLDIGEGGQIVGIEILDASHRVNLQRLLPVEYAGVGSK